MGGARGSELLILLLVVLLLFGAKRLPETARGLGKSLRILKAETRGLREDDEADADRHVAGTVAGSTTSSPAAPAAAAPSASSSGSSVQPQPRILDRSEVREHEVHLRDVTER